MSAYKTASLSACQRRYDNEAEPAHDWRVTARRSRCRQCGEWFTEAAPGNPNICKSCGDDDSTNQESTT